MLDTPAASWRSRRCFRCRPCPQPPHHGAEPAVPTPYLHGLSPAPIGAAAGASEHRRKQYPARCAFPCDRRCLPRLCSGASLASDLGNPFLQSWPRHHKGSPSPAGVATEPLMHFSFEHHCHHCRHAIRDQSALLPLTQVDMTGESGWAGSVPTPFGSVGSGAAPVLYHDSWTHGATWAGMEVFPPLPRSLADAWTIRG